MAPFLCSEFLGNKINRVQEQHVGGEKRTGQTPGALKVASFRKKIGKQSSLIISLVIMSLV